MDEPEEPRRAPAGPPGTPLPRLWKATPEPTPDDDPPSPKKKKRGADAASDDSTASKKPGKKTKGEKKGKASAKGADGAEKGKLLEETPTLDTYEARRMARIITGVVLAGLVLLIGFIIVQVFRPAQTEVTETTDEGLLTRTPSTDPQRAEREARSMLARAREVAERGNATLALSLLKKVAQSYPRTKVAQEAREAIERPAKNLPLFLDRPAVVAKSAEAPEPSKPAEPTKVVEATKVAAPEATGGNAQLVLPANPAEGGLASNANPPPKDETPSKPLPAGFRKRPGTRVHSSGWPAEIVGDRDGAPMVLVPGGTFTMGRDNGDENEAPAHKVTLSTYYIDQHEVTVRQFDLFQKEAGKRTDRERAIAKMEHHGEPSEDSPVVMVSARDASDYAGWAGKRLPTEAQWEMAARGTDGRIYPWGSEPPHWEKPRAPRQIDPIRSFPSDVSPLGVYDLGGNAWEWTKDWYDPKYYQLFRNTTADNPTGPSNRPKSQQLTVKGLSKNWVVTHREGLRWDTRLPYLGFRCVLPVEGLGNVPQAPSSPGPNQPAPNANGGVIPF